METIFWITIIIVILLSILHSFYSILLRHYYGAKLDKIIAVKNNHNLDTLKKLRKLESSLKKQTLFQSFFLPQSDRKILILLIESEIEKIHREWISIDLFMLLIEARDEYENLNGLTTSEDEEL